MDLTTFYHVTMDGDFTVLTCKGCGRMSYLVNTDKAGRARAMNHGLTHKGHEQKQLPIQPKK